MAAAKYGDGELAVIREGRVQKSPQAPAKPQRVDACTCCPYGYHIDLDFVQYAADEAKSGLPDSTKLLKKVGQRARTPSKSIEEETGVDGELVNRKSVYENVPSTRRRVGDGASGKTIKTSPVSGTRLENQCLFSDSLENVMSDFEETLSRGRSRKDYNSDYEQGKRRTPMALNILQRSPGLSGKKDGYASDCGYAVPSATPSRPTTLKYAPTNHYYASPAVTTGQPARLSDSMSSLSSASSTHNTNGGISTTAPLPLRIEPSNSFGHDSRPSLDNSFGQSRLTPLSPGLLSPRLLTSSPVPLKPSLGLSGRVGAQIEHLASHLDQAAGNRAVSPTRRILELENRIRSIPGPAFGGEKRRLQDELNRLVNEGKKTGYYRSMTPTVLDTGGYATALARAMSSVAAAQQVTPVPEPPPRRESVTRMQAAPPATNPNQARIRTVSASNGPANGNGSLNLDAFYSYRRTNPPSLSTTPVPRPIMPRSASAGPREEMDYVSDSEYALGDRSVDRFAALRRSRHLLNRPQTTLPPSVYPETSREEDKTRNGTGHRPTVIEVNGDPRPLTRTIGVVTDQPKPIHKHNVSTCTAPLPQPKPCQECDGLRQRILELSVKPLTFTRGTETVKCTCERCHRESSKTYTSVGFGTSMQDTAGYRRDAASTAEIEIPCLDCRDRNSIVKMNFGVNTERGAFGRGIEIGSNTDGVEVRNRHVNTEQQILKTSWVNTEPAQTKNAESMVEKSVLLSCGGYRTITSNTTPPLMVTFGVNTENGKNQESANIPDDVKLGRTVAVETRDECTWTEDTYFPKKIEEKKEVEKKSVGVGTSFVASISRMVDKYVDSTVKTRDVGTRTPPPPPPPLQPLRSSSCQTINEIKTMVSTASGDCTLDLSECDVCKGSGEKSMINGRSPVFEVETQTENGVSARSSVACGTDQSNDYQVGNRWEMVSSPSNSSTYSRQSSEGVNKEQSISIKESIITETMITNQESKPEPRPRGIQRIFTSPKPEPRKEQDMDPSMWTSQTSVTSDTSDRGADLIEESTVVCPLDDEEPTEEIDEPKQSGRKFDFTKPRQTRAFALSKAAAAKKLLTSDTQSQPKASTSGKQQSNFQRTAIQSKSVRVDSKKGDSLAYITEKKQFQGSSATTSKVVKNSTNTQMAQSSGLKGKVAIKKSGAVRKTTPAASGTRSKTGPLPYQRRVTSLPGTDGSLTSSLKDEEAAAEAEDTVGPLPSEVARWSETACYTNMAMENGQSESRSHRPASKLVGEIVDLPTKVETNGDESSSEESEAGEETDDSLDEGSYDTNGNISATCELGPGDSTISEDTATSAKFEMSPQLREACTALNQHLMAGKSLPGEDHVEWAHKFLQHEWLKTAASKRANPVHVGDFLDVLEDFSPQLLRQVVNFCDQNENTALHYAVSRGHFDVVSLLLDTKMCNLNKPNKAGYTPVMLASLCPITSDTDSMVIQRLFQMGDVNIKASQHGQTALMLAVSHGNLETTKLLLEAGAGVNIQDEEGSTALMCAAEHGHKEIVRLLLAHPEIDASVTDNDKSTALSIAVDNDHKDIGILIYAHLNYERPPPSFQSQSAPVWC